MLPVARDRFYEVDFCEIGVSTQFQQGREIGDASAETKLDFDEIR